MPNRWIDSSDADSYFEAQAERRDGYGPDDEIEPGSGDFPLQPFGAPRPPCRYCGQPRPAGYAITCGRSDCQEAAYNDRERRPAPRRRK